MKVTIGPQTFCPVKFSTYQVGQIEIEIEIGPNETPADAYARAINELGPTLLMHFNFARQLYFSRLPHTATP